MGWGHESERVVRVAIRRSRRTWRTFRIPLEFQQKAWMWLFCQIRQVSEFCTGNELKNPCVWCSAVAYWCGAVAPRAIAALLGRFLPRLGPLVIQAALFSLGVILPCHSGTRSKPESRGYGLSPPGCFGMTDDG